MQFPSIEWFNAVQKEAEIEADTFRRMGFCDATMLLALGPGDDARRFILAFEDYGMTSVREVDESESADADFQLSADNTVWREMIENIRTHGEADLEHTLNRLQLPGALALSASDQQNEDLFYRYNQTFQEFFNLSSRVQTEFSVDASA